MMFSKRRNALASRAVVASIALCGARAQSADETRFLTAVASPKIIEVGVTPSGGNPSGGEGDGFVVISFKTGPNLVSLDFTASCYLQDWSLPTNDCKAIGYDRNGPAGVSWTGETGKTYTELVGTITGLDAAETYDCFIFTKGPQGKEKCKYVGSTDIGCFEAEPVSIESTSGPIVFGDATAIPDPIGPFYGLQIDYEMLGVGNPPIESGLAESLGFLCLPGPYATCPSSWLTSDLLTLAFPNYPATTGGSLVFADGTFVGSEAIAGTNTTPDEGALVVPNTLYSCFSVLEDTCSPTSSPVCSDPVELISPAILAVPTNDGQVPPAVNPLFVSEGDGQVTTTCDRTAAVGNEGDALEVFNMWTCTGAGAWFPIECDATPQTRAITGFDGTGVTEVTCVLWQGQGELGGGCHPDSPDQCNWQASGADPEYGFWSETVTYTT